TEVTRMEREGREATPTEARPAIRRTTLRTAPIDPRVLVEQVQISRIEMPPHERAGLHVHPCPVVGVVLAGSVLFQVEGEAERVLHAGDAFFEPANARIAHFDAQERGATFVAHYLMESGATELIVMLDE
ncbi:MAG TPA: cupin domain-containing protein, partial [Gemmatimonadaceae bacterium]|nr:cupin domain-containing protein [Gemmatimonadaceae bacterium]